MKLDGRSLLHSIKGTALGAVVPLLAVLFALLVCAGLIAAAGSNPLQAYGALLEGAFGNARAIGATGVRLSPLLLAGLGIGIGFRAGVFNVGAEGQIYAGAAAATAVGILPLSLPGPLHIILAMAAGFLGGALWALLPAYLRAYRGISEVVITLMMNYVGIYFASYLVHDIMSDPTASYPQSPLVEASARLSNILPGTSLHAGVVFGLVLGVLLYFFIQYTPYGFKLRMIGANPKASRYAGVNVKAQLLSVMLISGGLAGLAGGVEVLGLKYRLYDMFSQGLGYQAIAVALLGNSNPLGIILSAVFFGGLRAGANTMQQAAGIEVSITIVIQALVVLFVIAAGTGTLGGLRRKARRVDDAGSMEPPGGASDAGGKKEALTVGS